MVRVARETDPKKIIELKKRINDHRYVAFAVGKIADELAKRFLGER